ncbi:MAG: M20/M25/M40 family metallo-hydrolase [Ruminococcaceae bacterium]|nr:M20/M25/M40 family metallo-hydrolase [Oscillospiraceae bacterium]
MVGIIIAVLVVLFFGFLCLNALNFKPKEDVNIIEEDIEFDKEKATKNLQELVKYKTVSYQDSSMEDEKEFTKLVKALPKLYPKVFKTCTLKLSKERGLLFLWEGKSHDAPSVMMAHYDVVPVNENGWERDPFGAELVDGVVWGRGTLDTKATMNGILSAAEALIKDGFIPENDIYFAFSGNEEINGLGAPAIVDYFEENKIELALVLDEGGAVVEGVFPGVKERCGLIGIAEKGMLNVEYKAKTAGGHASAPKPNSPIPSLAEVCCRIEENPFKMHITPPVSKMFDTLGRHSSFLYKLIFSNLWFFAPVLNMICKIQGGELNALMRTTVAFTKAQGSDAFNVIPPEATLCSNIRLNPADTMDSALEYLKKIADNENIEITALGGMNPSRISQTDCEAFDKVAMAVASTWQGTLVSPYLMVQCSDSRHYGRISDKVYRFSAMELSTEERATIHGNNERIPVETIHKAVEFFIRLMKQC